MPHRIILHVGPHKTGSTALQQMLLAMQGPLAERGILYPDAGLMSFGHHGIADFCGGRPSMFRPDDLRAEAAGAGILLLSSENFVVPSVDGLLRLAEIFPDADVRVVWCLRRLVDLWPSHWQEMVKHGQSMPFPEYLAQAAMGWPESGWGALNQSDQLGKLEAAFGSRSLTVVGYDLIAARGQDIGSHFLGEILGEPGLAADAAATLVNVALKDWQLELIRILNAVRDEAGGQPVDGSFRERLLVVLKSNPPDWLEDFKALVAGSPGFEIDSESPLVQALQYRIVDRFGDRFLGGRAEVAAEYFALRRRTIPNVTVPLLRSERLRHQIEKFYRFLTG